MSFKPVIFLAFANDMKQAVVLILRAFRIKVEVSQIDTAQFAHEENAQLDIREAFALGLME